MARKISVEILGDASGLERSFRKASRSATGFNRDLNHAGRGALAATVGFRGLGRSVAFASSAFLGGAGLTVALKSSIQAASAFEDTMQKIVGLSGVAQKQVRGFTSDVLKLAPAVGKSPQELAEALYFITSSGIPAAKAMDVLTASAKAATAGLGETQVVADAVTSAMNAYGTANLSATHATDVLVATVREGKGEAADFAGVIGNVAALAAQLGVSFNDVGAALAAETRLGIDAETASVQLQQVFSNLVKVAPQAEKAFKKVGLSSAGLRKELAGKGLLATLTTIKKAFAGDLPDLAKAFPNIRALRGVLALVGKQADATADIFDRMKDTSGSLKTAFDAVSKDTAQKFRQLRASAEVAGISIGAAFAPLAGKVAASLTKAAGEFSDFVERLSAAQTIRAKLNVVWEGARDAAEGAQSALAGAVAGIDWDKVWAGTRGIADGLQAKLEQVDWRQVGGAIGDGISTAVDKAIPATKEIAGRIATAVRTIDWNDLGRAIGPGLAAAVVSAFATLLDPSFWLKNWDLALAIGLTAFGGAIGKVAGKVGARFAAPLARIGGDLVLKIAAGIDRLAPKVGDALAGALGRAADAAERFGGRIGRTLAAGIDRAAVAVINAARGLADGLLGVFVKLPQTVARALEPLTNRVKEAFGGLGRLARFTIKVLGIQAAIDAVADAFHRIAHIISSSLDNAYEAMKKSAVKAALAILQPFASLPSKFGGWARNAKKQLQAQLDGMESAAKKTVDNINKTFGAVVQPEFGLNRGANPFARTPKTGARRAASASAATSTSDAATSTAAKAAATTVEKGFTLPFRLQLAQAKADATAAVGDDLKVARQIRRFLLKAIPNLGGQKLLDAYQQLGTVNGQLAAAVKQAGETGKAFVVPLKLQVAQARADALGNTDQTEKVLRQIRTAAEKALKAGKLGLQGQLDAWNTIAQVNGQLGDAFTTSKIRVPSTRKLTAGLDLDRTQRLALEARLSKITAQPPVGHVATVKAAAARQTAVVPGGGITITGPINIHGVQDIDGLTEQLRKRAKRTAGQTSGRNPGVVHGLG